jgi:hypothetical protein
MIEVVLVAAAMALAACSDAPPSTPTPVTPVCTSVFPFPLNPLPSLSVPADGGQGIIFVGAFPEICTFKAVSNAPFISVVSVQSSDSKGGGRPVVLNIAPNPSPSPRTGTVTLADTLSAAGFVSGDGK